MSTTTKSVSPSKPSRPEHDAPGFPPIAHEPDAVGPALTASLLPPQIPRHESVRPTKPGEGKLRLQCPERRRAEPAGSSVRTDLCDGGVQQQCGQ